MEGKVDESLREYGWLSVVGSNHHQKLISPDLTLLLFVKRVHTKIKIKIYNKGTYNRLSAQP
jgi:hypothetical protein